MISLTADVGLHESLLPVDHPEQASLDDVFKVGSELVVVRGATSAGGKLLVGRGFLGTARAAHADGASLAAFSLEDAGGGGVTVTNVTLTDAQIKALPTTPVVIVPDPGAGKFIIPLLAFLRMTPADFVNYDNIDPTANILLGDLMPVFVEPVQAAVSGFIGDSGFGNVIAATEQTIGTSLTQPNIAWADGDLDGAWRINAANGSAGNFTGGDPGNTMQIAVSYFVFDTATGRFS